MKALFFIPYPENCVPGQRLKFEQYFAIFKDNGIECHTRPFISPAFYKILYKKGACLSKFLYTLHGYIKRLFNVMEAARFDMVYIFLYAAPFGPPVFEYLLKLMGKKIIYDIDDVIFLPHSSDANRFTRYLRAEKMVRKRIRMADYVIAVTKYLEKYALKYNNRVILIPPTMDTKKYFVKHREDKKTVCIGWSGSHSTTQYLLLLESALKKVKDRYGDRCRIKVIGDKNFRFKNLAAHAVDWNLSTEVEELQEIDIGLYPLPECEWVMGKGGLKAIQYMALGLPAVSTRIGEVLDIVEDGVNGFLASSEEEWIRKISILIDGYELRCRVGRMARKTVEERYSLDVNAQKYLKVFDHVNRH